MKSVVIGRAPTVLWRESGSRILVSVLPMMRMTCISAAENRADEARQRGSRVSAMKTMSAERTRRNMTRQSRRLQLAGSVALSLLCVSPARAQSVAPTTRTDTIAAAQSEKAKDLQPYVGNKGERFVNALEASVIGGGMKWHPFFESALAGGGFTLGAGYRQHVSSYNSVDLRGSFTVKGYTRLEAEFLAPRLFDRRARTVGDGGLAPGHSGGLLRNRDKRNVSG